MPDATPAPSTPPAALPPHASDLTDWGLTLPSGLRVLAGLGETPEGCLYFAQSPTGLQVDVLIPRPENGRTPSSSLKLVGRVRQRIREERMRQVMQIKHPNVIEVYETGETSDGSFYIVLERPAGELLSTILAARGPRPVQEAVELCLQASEGLQAAHALGIAHGNVSPQTILVAGAANGRPRLKLLGFHLGPFLRGSGPEEWASAKYASPEQQCGVAADQRSDVFSLGAVFHHLLSGAPPDAGSVAGSIPQIARGVLTKALAQVPAQRFQSISAFASALERAAGAVSRSTGGAVSRPKKVWAGRAFLPRAARVARSIPRMARAMVIQTLGLVPAQRILSIAAYAGRALLRGTARVARSIPRMARAIFIKALVQPIRSIAASVGRRRLLRTAGAALIGTGTWLFWSSHSEAIGAEVRSTLQEARRGLQEARRGLVGERDSARRELAATLPARPPRLGRASPAESLPGPAAARLARPPRLGRASTPVTPRDTGLRRVAAGAYQPSGLHSDSAPQPLISPFRRSHPWAAPPGGRFYYRSSCPAALKFTDLVFFTSEREARASGLVPTSVPGCH